MTAFLGMATKFSEVTLAQKYRDVDEVGGAHSWEGSVSGETEGIPGTEEADKLAADFFVSFLALLNILLLRFLGIIFTIYHV